MDYTNSCEDYLFELDYYNETGDVKAFFNADMKERFMRFDERLVYYIRSLGCDEENIKKYINKCLRRKEISIGSKNTLNNWFMGKAPKKSDETREKLYIIAFALDMDADQTAELFRKVYFDRPFDPRNIKEFVYWYCLRNHRTYQKALEMIKRISGIVKDTYVERDNKESTMLETKLLLNKKFTDDEDEVIRFVTDNISSFRTHNKKANEVKNLLIKEIRVSKEDKDNIRKGRWNDVKSIIALEARLDGSARELLEKGKRDICSIQCMIDFIRMSKGKSVDGEIRISQKDVIPYEIKTNFPANRSLYTREEEKLSYDELRKMIIFLYSYKLWAEALIENRESPDYDEYISEMNTVLYECGLQTMYMGNPYDWMFAYCAEYDNPLDVFREIMSEIYELAE